MAAEHGERGERQRERQEGLGKVPARPVDAELVGIGEEGRRAEEPVPDEPELIVELQGVGGHAGQDGQLGQLASPDGQPPGDLCRQRSRHDQPGGQRERRDHECRSSHAGLSTRSIRRRSNQTPTPPRYAHGNSRTAGRGTVKGSASST